jgi:3-phytase
VTLVALTYRLAENANTASRIKVADIAVTDDALGGNVLTLQGADASRFEIEGNVLYLKAGIALDYETQASYSVEVQAKDTALTSSTAVTAPYTLTVTDVNEAPSTSKPASRWTSKPKRATASRYRRKTRRCRAARPLPRPTC